jgi:hypothetical protein
MNFSVGLKLPRDKVGMVDEESHKQISEVPIVPIIDMLVAIIFFLLLSTTFFNLTFQSVPPSKNITITDPQVPPPPSPKLFIDDENNVLHLTLAWSGPQAGQRDMRFPLSTAKDYSPQIASMAKTMVEEFLRVYPRESSIQVGLSPELPVQILLSTVEGINKTPLSVVLVSYKDVVAFKNRLINSSNSGVE